MRKLISFVAFVFLSVFLCAPVLATESSIAVSSTQTVLVDGKAVTFETYALLDANGYMTNYAKLRDVAWVLNGTKAQFNVDWSVERGIYAQTGTPYVANGSEMHTPYTGNRVYTPGVPTTDVNGSAVALDAIVLNDDAGGGYTYYKLRDLGPALGFVVDWDPQTGVTISTQSIPPENQTISQEKKELNAEEVYAKCSNSVAYIEAINSHGDVCKTGSGFFIDNVGTLVTNYHVIDGAYDATATLPDGTKYNVEGAYDFSTDQDWAVLKIAGNNPSYLKIGTSDTVVGGASVFALGSPLGMQDTISSGLISNASRIDDGVKYIQTNAAISSGSSGGALINKYGEVIGITSASYADGQNLNLALPLDYILGYQNGTTKTLTAIVENDYTIIEPYEMFSDIPDFGKYYGVEMLDMEAKRNTTYMYYRVSDIANRGSLRGYGIKNYKKVLEDWGATFDEFYFEMPYVDRAELHTTKYDYEIRFGYPDEDAMEKRIIVAITKTARGSAIGYSKWPAAPDFGAFFNITRDDGSDINIGGRVFLTAYMYSIQELSQRGNPDDSFWLYVDLLEEWGFRFVDSENNSTETVIYSFQKDAGNIHISYSIDYVQGVVHVNVSNFD